MSARPWEFVRHPGPEDGHSPYNVTFCTGPRGCTRAEYMKARRQARDSTMGHWPAPLFGAPTETGFVYFRINCAWARRQAIEKRAQA